MGTTVNPGALWCIGALPEAQGWSRKCYAYIVIYSDGDRVRHLLFSDELLMYQVSHVGREIWEHVD